MGRALVRQVMCLVWVTVVGGCAVREVPPVLPDSFSGIPLNGGRTQAVAVHPRNSNEIIIATEFGGFWKTTDYGKRWRPVRGLITVGAIDVQYGADGETVVATLARDNATDNGGGIYVSRDGGDSWSRHRTGVIPSDPDRSPERGSAWGISRAPDDPGRWYVGTTYGIARSSDSGATWEHFQIDTNLPVTSAPRTFFGEPYQDSAQSVVALRNGIVLAMLDSGIYRSDDFGGAWRPIKTGDFKAYHGGLKGFNKLERNRAGVNAYAVENYDTLHYYESTADRWTALALPGGGSRGPFVRVSDIPLILRAFDAGGVTEGWEMIWVSQGTRVAVAFGTDPAGIRGLQPDDWSLYGRGDGIHDDMGDLGVSRDVGSPGYPILLGSDGGVFKPNSGSLLDWVSGAPPGSRFNSWQMSDLGGTDVTQSDGSVASYIYFTTQDNGVWGSSDGGRSFDRSDCAEGSHLEVANRAEAGDKVTVGYGRVGCGYNSRFADPGLVSQRNVPETLVGGGTVQPLAQAFYLAPGRWQRYRSATGTGETATPPEIYVSTDDGDTWRKRFTLNLNRQGVPQRSNIHFTPANVSAYLPVATGDANPPDMGRQIGLVRLNDQFGSGVATIGTGDIIELPDDGSLGRRATQFDWQAVFGVHPRDARFILAPDIVNGVVKVTHDGGNTWTTDVRLTTVVTQNGRLKLWDHDPYQMQVTHFAYDPDNEDLIFVGTRDAGVVCSNDRGLTWLMLDGTEPITYVTGFHFFKNGEVLVSTYGRGLWKLKRSIADCESGENWVELPTIPGGIPQPVPQRPPGGWRLVDLEDDLGAAMTPSGEDVPGRPMALLGSTSGAGGGTVLGSDNVLYLRVRGFTAGAGLTVHLDGQPEPLHQVGSTDGLGTAAFRITVPADLVQGEHRLEVREAGTDRVALAGFVKPNSDDHLGKPESERSQPTLAEILERLAKEYKGDIGQEEPKS